MPSTLRAHASSRTVRIQFGAAVALAIVPALAAAQETVRVSVDSSGNEGDNQSGTNYPIAMTADGAIVAFTSGATNLVSNDFNLKWDIFVHDRTTAMTERISLDPLGNEGNGNSFAPAMSGDGQFVAFESDASNLVSGDGNAARDVFVRDRSMGTTERVSVDSVGTEANYGADTPQISSDGRFVLFSSWSTNLVPGDTNQSSDVFLHDRATGVTERISVDSAGVEGNDWSGFGDPSSVSADGNLVAFSSKATNLVAGDTNGTFDIFVHDRSTGVTERVNVSSSGQEANDASFGPSISADGCFVAFDSGASNLVPHDYAYVDIFVHDRTTGTTERVSVDSSGVAGNGDSSPAMISADGNFVAFASYAGNLVPGDTNGDSDIFVHDRATGSTERENVDSSGAQDDGLSFAPSISASGIVVGFASEAPDLVANDTNNFFDVFVHEDCGTAATWSNYDVGFPGTKGVPSFTSQQNPSFGSTVTLDLENSYGQPTAGLLLVGFQRAYAPTNRGGNLLVSPALTIPITFWYGDDTFSGTIPRDDSYCGVAIDLQALEVDPGAAKGVSFTQGLELVIGN